jgi:hypothetical protein
MRSVFLSLVLAIVVFALFAALPASLGLVSLVRALLFLAGAGCLVAVVMSTFASVLGTHRLVRLH